jgi:polyhydroxybutyrate depolymerase
MWIALALLVVLLMLGGAAYYLLHARHAPVPLVQGTLAHRQLATAHGVRHYDTYVPRELVPDAPLVIALHGLGQDREAMRALIGQALEQQARVCGFAVAYLAAAQAGWGRDYADDEAFILAMIEAAVGEHAIDTEQVYVLGYGSGGQLVYRLALTVPQHLAGVAVIAASLPATDERAQAADGEAVPMLIINGTADRLNPFNGGAGSWFGLARRDAVRSSMATAAVFADLAGARLLQDETLLAHQLPRLAPMRSVWSNAQGIAVVMYAVKGGGHVVHQPFARQPRWLGAMNPGFDVTAQACLFWQL